MKKVKHMIFIKSLMVALSTYSIIPVPQFEWNEKNMKYAICFFPAVGIVCGLLVFLLGKAGEILEMSSFFASAVTLCIPLLVTGGIHMDGFMDTVDAISSGKPMQEKLKILSDPHAGAFAVIYCIVYLILNMAFVHEIYSQGSIFALCPLYVLSRSMSALCAVNLPNARGGGMLSLYTKGAEIKTVNISMSLTALLCAGIMFVFSPVIGAFVTGAGLLWTVIYRTLVKKHFGGVTGDTAGFFLLMFELVCTAAIWIGAVV